MKAISSKRFILVVLGLLAIALQNVLSLDPQAIEKILYIIMAYVGGETVRPTGTKVMLKGGKK